MTTAEKNAIISSLILGHVATGLALRDAIDAVLGAGTYQRIADETYDALLARAAAQ